MFGRKRIEPTVKLCSNCRHWSGSDNVAQFGTAELSGQCRRFPPRVISSTEYEKIMNASKHKDRTPYIPDSAWGPLHIWPLTRGTEWCGEWSYPEKDDWQRMAELASMNQRLAEGRTKDSD